MEASLSPTMNEDASDELSSHTHPTKKRKNVEKTVVRVRIGTEFGKEKNEGPPSDSWSWRKYGQKPIKGSPYPRGYYRCSMSKGCSAKKQVERCKSDASVLVVTYTSSHNHPEGGGDHSRNQQQKSPHSRRDPSQGREHGTTTSLQDDDGEAQGAYRPTMEAAEEEFSYSHDLQVEELFSHGSLGLVLSGEESSGLDVLSMDNGGGCNNSELIITPTTTTTTTTKSEVEEEAEEEEYYEFFDELEELYPTVSLFSDHHRRHHHHQLVR